MNRIVLAPTVLALTFFTTCANANIDQLKGLLGGKKAESTVTSSSLTEMATSAASNIDLASLVSSVAGNLNVSENQSEGGIASIMNYVQGNLSGADYAQLASSIPGIDSLLEDVPSLSGNSAARSSSSLSGSSLDAPITVSNGTLIRSMPLSNFLSFSMVSKEFNIALLALKISSRNATLAVGKYLSILRTYLSFSS